MNRSLIISLAATTVAAGLLLLGLAGCSAGNDDGDIVGVATDLPALVATDLPALVATDQPAGESEALEDDGMLSGAAGQVEPPAGEAAAAPVGLLYRVMTEGIYQVLTGENRLLSSRENGLPSPDGRYIAHRDEAGQLWVADASSGREAPLGQELALSPFFWWGDADTLIVGVWLDPSEGEGPNIGHVATLDVADGALKVLDELYLSGNRPAMAADGQRVAFDVFQQPPLTGRIYLPETGLQAFDPADYAGALESSSGPAFFNPAWSPAGDQITWLGSTGERVYLQLFDLERQTAVSLFDWDPARFGALIPSPVWSPDGAWLAIEVWANMNQGSGLWLVAADGRETLLVDAQGGDPTWISPTQLVYNQYDENRNSQVRQYDLAARSSVLLDLPAGSAVIGHAAPSG